MSPTTDAANALSGADEASASSLIRNRKPEQVAALQEYYQALFEPSEASLRHVSLSHRALVAVRVAAHTGSGRVADWYVGVARSAGASAAEIDAALDLATAWEGSAPLPAAIRRADLVTRTPAAARPEHIAELAAAGLTPAGIVTISQVIAFVAYQLRFAAVLRALNGQGPAERPTGAPLLAPQEADFGHGGLGWTLDYLGWQPWVTRSVETDLEPEVRARVEAVLSARQNSDYLAVLTNDYAAWKARDAVHHHTFADDSDAQTGWREFGSVVASRINGCVFCAAVHARIYAAKSGNRRVIDAFLRDGLDADLPPVERAIADLGARLTNSPESLIGADLDPLRALGFADDQILDIANYNAFFANANRLMLTLGAPVLQRPYRG